MIVPTTPDWAVGNYFTAARANSEIRDALDFLLDPPRCHVSDGTGITLTNATATLVTWDTETFDNDTMHSTSVNTGRITFTTAGAYQINWILSLPAATYTALDLNVRLNAAGSSVGGTSLRTQPFDTQSSRTVQYQMIRSFSAADYVELFVTQTSGANRALAAVTHGTACHARWIAR